MGKMGTDVVTDMQLPAVPSTMGVLCLDSYRTVMRPVKADNAPLLRRVIERMHSVDRQRCAVECG